MANLSHAQCLKQLEEKLQLSGSQESARNFVIKYMQGAKRSGNWTIDLEKIMSQFIHLTIQLENFSDVRELFNQYRNICQSQNPESLEVLCNQYKSQIEKTFNPKLKSYPKETIDKIIEIESEQQPDQYLIFASKKNDQEKLEELRQLLRIIWDSFKIIIDVVKSNRQLEELYKQTIQEAFVFCETYNRKAELKQLIDLLRSHLNTLITYGANKDKNQNFIDITNQETNERYINIRFDAFNYAKKYNMWQDGYRILEDINTLINNRGKTVLKSRFQSEYYERLAEVFWQAEYYNYHAYFFYNHYLIFKKKPNYSEKQMTEQIDRVILSILSIPPHPIEGQSEDGHHKIAALMHQGTNQSIPSRDDLIKLIEHTNLCDLASPIVKSIFDLMEGDDFDIFNFSEKCSSLLVKLKAPESTQIAGLTNSFVPLLEQNFIYKVLKNFGQIYKTLKMENLLQILSFVTPARCHQTLVYANAHSIVQCKVDHFQNIIIFTEQFSEDYIDASQKIINLAQEVKLLASTLPTSNPKNNEQRVNEIKEDATQYLDEAEETVQTRLDNVIKMRKQEIQKISRKEQKLAEEEKLIEQQSMLERVAQSNKQKKEQQRLQQLRNEDNKKKEKLLQDILQIQGAQVAKIMSQKIEKLTYQEIEEIPIETFEDLKKKILKQQEEESDNKFKKAYARWDFFEREKRKFELERLQKQADYQINEAEEQKKLSESARLDFDKNQNIQDGTMKTKNFKDEYFKSIITAKEEEYKEKLQQFKEQINKNFRQEIIKRAKSALEQDKKKQKAQEEERKLQDALKLQEQIQNIEDKSDFIILRAPQRDPKEVESSKPNVTSAAITISENISRNTNFNKNLSAPASAIVRGPPVQEKKSDAPLTRNFNKDTNVSSSNTGNSSNSFRRNEDSNKFKPSPSDTTGISRTQNSNNSSTTNPTGTGGIIGRNMGSSSSSTVPSTNNNNNPKTIGTTHPGRATNNFSKANSSNPAPPNTTGTGGIGRRKID